MFLKQLSVIIQNQKGTLAHCTRLLGEQDIDILSINIVDTGTYGTLRAIVSDPQAAMKLLAGEGYPVTVSDVLAVRLQDEKGELARLTGFLEAEGISVEYLYSGIRQIDGLGMIILRANLPGEALALLQGAGYRLLGSKEAQTPLPE